MGDRLATIDMGRKLPGLCPFGGAGSPCNNVACVEAYLRTKWHLDPSSRLAITDMGRFFFGGGLFPLGSGAESASNTMLPGPRPTIVSSGIVIHPPFGHNKHGPKIGGLCPVCLGRGSWVPI